jgi:S1-C subfamily serine protease
MTFLDEVPQDWTRPELPQLRDLFVQAYRRRTAAEDLADSAGLVPGMFPERENLRSTWTALIQVMGAQAGLRTLVERAAADPVAAAFRPRFEEMLEAGPALQPPPGLPAQETWWKGDDVVPAVAARLREERLMERRSRLLGIELAASMVSAAGSVAKLSLRFGTERGHGTGFLIGHDLLLTNHHNTVHAVYGPVTSLVAEFDFDQGVHIEKPLVRAAHVEDAVGDPVDDWAVVRLVTPVDRPPLPLGSPFPVAIDDWVVIIQHPQGAFKQFALEPLAVRHVDSARIQYVADTQQGSSGSPVFNERMHVIALHQGEAEVTVPGTKETSWRNQGINIGRIMSSLRRRGIPFLEER